MLIFPLKKEWYEKIRSGEKNIEYREVKPYWTRRILWAEFGDINCHLDSEKGHYIFTKYFAPCILQLGYTKQRLEAWINKVEIVEGKNTDLHIDKPVYAIHLENVKEVEE